MIIVAVSSNGQRTLDYTPWPDVVEGRRVGGGAAAFGRYLTDELKPLIDQRFRTLPGRDTTAIGGSSLGGLVTAWLLVQHAQTFGAGLVVSPSVWWASGALLRYVQSADWRALKPPRVWLDMGGEEGGEMLAGARALRKLLQANGWPMHYLEAQGADHSEAAWAARVEDMLKFLYATVELPEARASSP
jgi:predicted alpha/beta superfamily hydrolase